VRDNNNNNLKREWCHYYNNFPHRSHDQITGEEIKLRLLGDGSQRKICEDCVAKIKIIRWFSRMVKNGEIPTNKPQHRELVGRECTRGEYLSWNRPVHRTEPYVSSATIGAVRYSSTARPIGTGSESQI
jgi:hypothetical protein